ncbi:MAG: hypothetical protein U1G08_10005 [Verrucomicrobiota bacterium]
MNRTHIALTFAGGFALVVWIFVFDRFIRRMCSHHRELWIAHGSPPGWIHVPQGASWFVGCLPRQRLISEIAFSMPTWVAGDPVLRRQWLGMTASYLALCSVILGMVGKALLGRA